MQGNWEPIVSTEEFERGIAILKKRGMERSPRRKPFYLLRGLVYLQTSDPDLVRLTCSFANANRRSGGSRYYCIYSRACYALNNLVWWASSTKRDAMRIAKAK